MATRFGQSLTSPGESPGDATTLSSGSIPFSDGTKFIEDNANLFWDDSNNRLGIGTASPGSTLHATGLTTIGTTAPTGTYFPANNAQTPTSIILSEDSAATTLDKATGAYLHNEDTTTGNNSFLAFSSKNTSGSNVAYSGIVGISGARNSTFFPGELAFFTRANLGSTMTEQMRIDSTGNAAVTGNVTANNLRLHNLIDNKAPADTTTSATFATLLSSASTSFSGRPVLFFLNASAFSTIITTIMEFAVQIDSGADNVVADFIFNTTSIHSTITGMALLTPSSGSHTINVRWRRVSGTGTVTADLNDQVLLYAVEL